MNFCWASEGSKVSLWYSGMSPSAGRGVTELTATRSGGSARFDRPRPTTLCGNGCICACGTHCPLASSPCVAAGPEDEVDAARLAAAIAAVSMYRFRSRSRNSHTSESESSP